MELKITPEVTAEYLPCPEARGLIVQAWEKRHPGIYGKGHYIGSGWYIEVPEYIDYLVRINETDFAKRLLDALLELDATDELHNKLWQEMTCHRLGRHCLGLDAIKDLLDNNDP